VPYCVIDYDCIEKWEGGGKEESSCIVMTPLGRKKKPAYSACGTDGKKGSQGSNSRDLLPISTRKKGERRGRGRRKQRHADLRREGKKKGESAAQ